MPDERYIESIIIRQDNAIVPEGDSPTFVDDDCDQEFEFEGTLMLKQILKSVQNATHNKHDYVFTIKSIKKITKQGD